MRLSESDSKTKISISIEKKILKKLNGFCNEKKDEKIPLSRLINHILRKGVIEIENGNIFCEICKIAYPSIHLHHIDGNHYNNALENRIYLCGQCHNLVHFPQESNMGKCPKRIRNMIIYYQNLLKNKGVYVPTLIPMDKFPLKLPLSKGVTL